MHGEVDELYDISRYHANILMKVWFAIIKSNNKDNGGKNNNYYYIIIMTVGFWLWLSLHVDFIYEAVHSEIRRDSVCLTRDMRSSVWRLCSPSLVKMSELQ